MSHLLRQFGIYYLTRSHNTGFGFNKIFLGIGLTPNFASIDYWHIRFNYKVVNSPTADYTINNQGLEA